MTITVTLNAWWVESTVVLQEDGSVIETAGHRFGPTINDDYVVTKEQAYPNLSTWIGAMNAESFRRAPFTTRREKLKAVGGTHASTVVWVKSKQHYMEIRRGEKTMFAEGERQTWSTAASWIESLTPPAIKVMDMPLPMAVPEVTMVDVAPPSPAACAFNHEKFQKDFDALIVWAQQKKSPLIKASAIIQICSWLLEMKALPAVAAWLEETPLWRVSIRTIVQAMEWEWTAPASAAAVADFLTKF